MYKIFLSVAVTVTLADFAVAHDTWVQTNTNVIRVGDAVHVDLMLGNHGNDHRDFKLASKVALDGCTLKVRDPGNHVYDLRDELTDAGYTPKEGFWTEKFAATTAGLYLVEHASDRVVNHGKPVRSLKSGKTFFVVSKSLDKVPLENPGYDRVLGHPLELVPTTNPVTPMGPGKPIGVRVLLKGKPLAEACVSFIPRGETLSEGFDERYERKTDSKGQAQFISSTGNYYLVVVHHKADDETGKDYEGTQYSATLTVFVPELCPCCGD
ncbi:MAG: DUF4198 domain-containing protein [Planctomycetia bacterium]|nr:DUF4198 domain-containing protein [Planctomycetia bacterium]